MCFCLTAFRALSHPTALPLLTSQCRRVHLLWHYYFQGGVYHLQTPGHDAHNRRTPATAVKHPAAQQGTALGRAGHTHYLCNPALGIRVPYTDNGQIVSASGPWPNTITADHVEVGSALLWLIPQRLEQRPQLQPAMRGKEDHDENIAFSRFCPF